jgi:protein AATF/BFR2
VDLYSHTHKFFKADKRTDDYARQVEVGERRIRTAADMDELDQKVYGGKRVSREDISRAAVVADEDSGSDEAGESYDDEEDMEDDDEEMEEESMEEDEDESEEGLPKVPKKLEKEAAAAVSEDDEEDEEGGLDAALRRLKEEEAEAQDVQRERASTEVEKGKSVRVQKKVFDQFLHQRILMQKLVTSANRLPTGPVLKAFSQRSTKIETSLKKCRREVKAYIKDTIKAQRELFKLSGTTIKIKEVPEDDEESTADSLYKTLDSNFTSMQPFLEETVDRWNSRTQMLKTLNQGSHKSA